MKVAHVLGKWNYINGKREGLFERFYENGKLMEEVNFTNNKTDGLANEYFENGMYKSMSVYKMGRLASKSTYDKDGIILEERRYLAIE